MASSASQLVSSIPPPFGVQPNFADPDCDRNVVYIPLSLCLGFATIFFAARVVTRTRIMKQITAEDYLLTLGWIFEVAFEASVYWRVQCGLSCHQWDLTAETVSCFSFRQYISNILYGATIVFLKLSILVQLKRIFTTAAKGSIYWIIIALICINTLFYSIWTIDQIFHCTPIQKAWTPGLSGSCQNLNSGQLFAPSLDLALNVAMLLLPLWILWKLELKIKQRFRASVIFAVGIIACVSSIFRIYYSAKVQASADVTWNYKGLAWATSLETGSGVIVASIPVLPRLVKWLRDRNDVGSGSSRKYYWQQRRLKPVSDDFYESSSAAPPSTGRKQSNLQVRQWIPLEDEPVAAKGVGNVHATVSVARGGEGRGLGDL